jgi:hypothetical protein
MAGDDPLQQLRDLHLPMEPSWFPPAPGWWAIAVVALALLFAGAALFRRRRRRRAPYRSARAEIAALHDAVTAGAAAPGDYANGASAVLKRLTVFALRRPEAAPLTGTRWLEFLDGLRGEPVFSGTVGNALGQARFAQHPELDVEALHRAVTELVDHLERRA